VSAQPPVTAPPSVDTATPQPGLQLIPRVEVLPGVDLQAVALAVAGIGVVTLIVALVYKAVRGRLAHPLAKSLSDWLTTGSADVLVLGLDPVTREAKLVPCKRVGSLYVGTSEPLYLVPVAGGETYILSGAGKPVIVALRYSRGAVQWGPASEQMLSLSLAPLEASGGAAASATELEDMLLSEVASKASQLSGYVYVGPDVKLYISARVPKALEEFKKYTSYSVSATLSTLSSALHAVAEEGYMVLEAQRRLVATRWEAVAKVILTVALAAAVIAIILYVMRMLG